MTLRNFVGGVMCALASTLAAQNIEFDSPWRAYDLGNYPEGNPWDSELVDLDGDGILDLASVSWGANGRLAVLFGNGRGGFERLTRYPLQSASLGMTVADFDGDGDPDIAVSNTGSLWDDATISVFQNQGDGTFVENGPFFAGFGPTGITAADFDADGDMDIAVAHDLYIQAGRSYAILRNDGTGTFGAPSIVATASSTYQAEAADMNGDGRPDLVIAGEMRDVTVLLNNGEGFAPPVTYLAMPNLYLDVYPTLELADADRDGDLDVFFSASNATIGTFGGVGQVGLLRNDGTGVLQTLETIPMLFREGGAVGVTVADVTEDGWPDILAAHGGQDWWGLLRGDGIGGFLAVEPFRSGDGPVSMTVGDVDADGVSDVVAVAAGSITAAVHRNEGGGQFAVLPFAEFVPGTGAPASYSRTGALDLDGDGDLDVAVGYSLNYLGEFGISVALNQGDGTFAPAQHYPSPTFPEMVEFVDLDGDGFADAVWVDDSFPFRSGFMRNQGDGTFGAAQVGPSLPTEADSMTMFDVDNDGDPDLLVGGTLDVVHVARNHGSGFEPFYDVAINNIAGAMVGGDLDRDGNMDLVTNSGIQGWLEVCLGNGDGTFQAPWTVQAGFAVAAMVIADLDGDGIPDIATANDNDVTMTVLIGRGPGLFKPPVAYPAGRSGYYGFQSIRAVDIDGDTDLDLVTGNFGSQDVSVWRNRGDGTFDRHARPGVGLPAWDVAVADFTGDGVVDLLAQVEPEGQNGWYYPAFSLIRGTAGDAWTDVGAGLAGTHGVPAHSGLSTFEPGQPYVLRVDDALESSAGALLLGGAQINAPLLGGVLVPSPDLALPFVTDVAGRFVLAASWVTGAPSGASIVTQAWVVDPVAVAGLAASNGLVAITP